MLNPTATAYMRTQNDSSVGGRQSTVGSRSRQSTVGRQSTVAVDSLLVLRSCDISAASADAIGRTTHLHDDAVPAAVGFAGCWIAERILLAQFVGDVLGGRIE